MKSLRTRLTLWYSIVVTATVAVALSGGFFLLRHQLTSNIDFLLDFQSQEIQVLLKENGMPMDKGGIHRALLEHSQVEASLYFFTIHTDQDGVLFVSPNLNNHPLPDLTFGPHKRTLTVPNLGQMRIAEYYPGKLHLQIAMSARHLEEMTNLFRRAMFFGLPMIFFLSVVVGNCFGSLLLHPLAVMQQTARRITAENLGERIPIAGQKDELAALGRLLNEMFARLETSFNQVRRFTSDTSHQLKTPLSVIRLQLEEVMKSGKLPEDLRGQLEDLNDEVLRMTTIIEKLLFLSKADAKAMPLHATISSSGRLVDDFYDDAKVLTDAQGLEFIVERKADAPLKIDESWMRQVFFNLLSNAQKFSPPGGKIYLDTWIDGRQWFAAMRDEGPGVPEEKLPLLFERFSQLHPELKMSGTGLGLAICRSILELHGGDIQCRNRAGGRGFEAIVSLPISANPK